MTKEQTIKSCIELLEITLGSMNSNNTDKVVGAVVEILKTLLPES